MLISSFIKCPLTPVSLYKVRSIKLGHYRNRLCDLMLLRANSIILAQYRHGLFVPVTYRSNSRPGFKTAPLFAQVSPGPKIKRSSVTDMPSDLDRSNKYRGKPAPRSKSYQELVIDTASADTSRVKDSRLLYNKSLEQSMITSGSGKSFIPEQIDTQAKISPQGGSAYSEQSVIFRSDLEATGRSGSDTIRYGKSLSTRDLDRFIEFNSRAKDSEYSDEAERKSNSQATDDDLNGKVYFIFVLFCLSV